MLTVTVAAEDRNLLSAAEMRLAFGLTADDASRDQELALVNARVSADICEACRIAIANGAEPTLRRETLTEIFRRTGPGPLILSRRHNIDVVSITIDGIDLQPTDYLVESEAGLIGRLRGDAEARWTGHKITTVYKAGFDEVPAGLIGAAMDLVRLRRSEASRDPLAKRERVDVDGIEAIETDYWVNAAGGSASPGSAVPAEILARLGRFATIWLG